MFQDQGGLLPVHSRKEIVKDSWRGVRNTVSTLDDDDDEANVERDVEMEQLRVLPKNSKRRMKKCWQKLRMF